MPRFLHCGWSARASRWASRPATRATATPTSWPEASATAAGCCSLSASTTSLRL